MRKIIIVFVLLLVISLPRGGEAALWGHLTFVILTSAQQLPGDPSGCFSNGDCTAEERANKCPDCSEVHFQNEVGEAEEERRGQEFVPPQDTGVTLPTVSPSPSPTPLVEEPFSIGPFILLLVFVLVILIVGYIIFRVRRAQTLQ